MIVQSTFLDFFFDQGLPKGACGMKKKFQKPLTLAFEVIVRLLAHTLFLYCTVFPFFAHGVLLNFNYD